MTHLLNILADTLGLTGEGWTIGHSTDRKQRNLAQIDWEPSRRAAHITLRPHGDIYLDAHKHQRPYALALTLTHELLHLRLEGHMEPEEAVLSPHHTPAFEYAVDSLAWVLVTGLVTAGLIDPEPVPAFKR